ncbi:MAG TPA: hypothetical protein VLF91_04710 [Candidatus Saccharimonadales bacterium]|nr:hypothetical protein [Candidatus Saccharimonadales bacterium]
MKHEKLPVVRDEAIRSLAPQMGHDDLQQWYQKLGGSRTAAELDWYGLARYSVRARSHYSRGRTFAVALSPVDEAYPQVSLRGRQTPRRASGSHQSIKDSAGNIVLYDWHWERLPLVWRRESPVSLDLVAKGSWLLCQYEPPIATVRAAAESDLTVDRAEELVISAGQLLVPQVVLLPEAHEPREPVDLTAAFLAPVV